MFSFFIVFKFVYSPFQRFQKITNPNYELPKGTKGALLHRSCVRGTQAAHPPLPPIPDITFTKSGLVEQIIEAFFCKKQNYQFQTGW
jgi:hypothetical protein